MVKLMAQMYGPGHTENSAERILWPSDIMAAIVLSSTCSWMFVVIQVEINTVQFQVYKIMINMIVQRK
jgi:hypothetical protein